MKISPLVDQADEALACAEAHAKPGSKDAALVSTARGRLSAYAQAVTGAPASDVVVNWVMPGVEAVAVEATSVKVRREGMFAFKSLTDARAVALQ